MNARAAALERVQRLVEAARHLVRPGAARQQLVSALAGSTGLSAPGVEWALDHCLELQPSPAELEALVASVRPAARAHVILPGNVFVAAHRALAVALAATPEVHVRPSRREPVFVEQLVSHAPGLLERVERLDVRAGDHVWAYGSDFTLQALRGELPRGAVLHAHGSGFGAVLLDFGPPGSRAHDAAVLRTWAEAIAYDTAAFDQRGCASPRLLVALGENERAEEFAAYLARALEAVEARLPRGRLDPDELADARWYSECAACFGRVLAAGQGAVHVPPPAERAAAVPAGSEVALPPVGRYLRIEWVAELEPVLAKLRPWLTAVGCSSPALEARAAAALPRARVSALGHMQHPSFDGPLDRRSDAAGELVT